MTTGPAELNGSSDGDLLNAVRAGDTAAYGELYERHVGAAHNLARQLTRTPSTADDLVSEAFAKVLARLRTGTGGPESAFRAYLLTTLRNVAHDRARQDRKITLSEDLTEVEPAAISVPFVDTAVAGLERTLAARAFTSLPKRWQAVLWHTEIEGRSPAQVALLLGLSPNGVSSLSYRAREGLRQAYLQVHLADTAASADARCRACIDRLGARIRGRLSKREITRVKAHLDTCERCSLLANELADIDSNGPVFVAPLVIGIKLYSEARTSTAAQAPEGGPPTCATAPVGDIPPRPRTRMIGNLMALLTVLACATADGHSTPPPTTAVTPVSAILPPVSLPTKTSTPPREAPGTDRLIELPRLRAVVCAGNKTDSAQVEWPTEHRPDCPV